MISSPGARTGLVPAVGLLLATVVVGVAALLLTGPVEVAIPVDAGNPACHAAADHWPEDLAGEGRTGTEPDAPTVAAWGDPAVIARCGMPPLGPTENQCIAVDDIDWVAEDLGDGTRLTTFGRDPAIEVLVPDERGPAPLLLPAFAEAAAELPTNDYACS